MKNAIVILGKNELNLYVMVKKSTNLLVDEDPVKHLEFQKADCFANGCIKK